MSITEAPAPPLEAEPHEGRRFGWRRLVRWFGFLCLCVAAGFGGYLGWLLWGTGLETQRAQDTLRSTFEPVVETRPPPPGEPTVRLPGQAYAQIQIPAIDADFIVVQGTNYEDLKKGPGHYPDTADPWDETGRVGIAGHRTTYLHPFLALDRLKRGDEIVLRTEYGTFTYRVTKNVIIPSAGSGRVLAQTERPTLVLTTCHPLFSSSQRLIVTASLDG
ncbi:MAG: sortase [Actinomycetota bacterium]